jgi:2-polyprenyl-3-methyl-5-hydroxy-6-metoxy-1,4-benzoquinol methylase
MKISRGLEDEGVVVGNAFDKYGSSNPVVRRIMRGFQESLSDLVNRTGPTTIHEIGCGEGYWVIHWQQLGFDARGSDFSQTVIDLAKSNAEENGFSSDLFQAKSIYDVSSAEDSADLLVCCEVLEHVDDPRGALAALQSVHASNVILSVPREPVWRALNMARGKYLGALGNTPGHIQHWSTKEFVKLVAEYFEVVEVKQPLPWTMLLARGTA